jgi:hypothetical protein
MSAARSNATSPNDLLNILATIAERGAGFRSLGQGRVPRPNDLLNILATIAQRCAGFRSLGDTVFFQKDFQNLFS